MSPSTSVARVGAHLIRLADRLQAEYPTTSAATVMRSIDAARHASRDSLPDVDRYLRRVDQHARVELVMSALVRPQGVRP